MYDDEHYPDPFDADDSPDAPPRRHGCLFVAVTLLVIVTLLGSSLAAWFVLGQRERSTAEVERRPTIAPATLVAALPTTAITSRPTVAPAAGPTVNRIVIVNDDGEVETLAPDGRDRRVLTRQGNSVFFQFPAWSPDGRRLAVISSRLSGGGIYVLPDAVGADNAPESQVYFSAEETPIYLYWSPDGATLAFLANQTRNQMGLKVIDSDGARASRLLATGEPFYWDWSADSRQLLVHIGEANGIGQLALIGVDGQTQADNLATPGIFQAPGIAPGGRYWAFAEDSDGRSALVIVDTQTGERRAFEQSDALSLSWSPTGDQLAFTNGAPDSPHFWGPLRVLDIASGQTRLLTRQTVLAYFWSPNGRSIAFITVNGDPQDGGINALAKTRQLTRLMRPAQQPGQGFLTLSVVDVATGEGLRLLDFQPTGVFLTQFLPFFDQYALSHRLWSPDSSALVLPVVEETGNWVLVVPAAGGRPFHLAEGDSAFWSRQ
jgi:TolB protein